MKSIAYDTCCVCVVFIVFLRDSCLLALQLLYAYTVKWQSISWMDGWINRYYTTTLYLMIKWLCDRNGGNTETKHIHSTSSHSSINNNNNSRIKQRCTIKAVVSYGFRCEMSANEFYSDIRYNRYGEWVDRYDQSASFHIYRWRKSEPYEVKPVSICHWCRPTVNHTNSLLYAYYGPIMCGRILPTFRCEKDEAFIFTCNRLQIEICVRIKVI